MAMSLRLCSLLLVAVLVARSSCGCVEKDGTVICSRGLYDNYNRKPQKNTRHVHWQDEDVFDDYSGGWKTAEVRVHENENWGGPEEGVQINKNVFAFPVGAKYTSDADTKRMIYQMSKDTYGVPLEKWSPDDIKKIGIQLSPDEYAIPVKSLNGPGSPWSKQSLQQISAEDFANYLATQKDNVEYWGPEEPIRNSMQVSKYSFEPNKNPVKTYNVAFPANDDWTSYVPPEPKKDA